MGGVVDVEVEREREAVQMGSSRRQGRIRLLRAHPRWEVLLIGKTRVVGEWEVGLVLERVRRGFVEQMLDRGAGRCYCCSPSWSLGRPRPGRDGRKVEVFGARSR